MGLLWDARRCQLGLTIDLGDPRQRGEVRDAGRQPHQPQLPADAGAEPQRLQVSRRPHRAPSAGLASVDDGAELSQLLESRGDAGAEGKHPRRAVGANGVP